MKNFKQLLSEIKSGNDWDNYIHSMFGHASDAPHENVPEEGLPHHDWLMRRLNGSIPLVHASPSGSDKMAFHHLPITSMKESDGKIHITADASEYAHHLSDHNISHNMARKLDVFGADEHHPELSKTSEEHLGKSLSMTLRHHIDEPNMHFDPKSKTMHVWLDADSIRGAKREERKRTDQYMNDATDWDRENRYDRGDFDYGQ